MGLIFDELIHQGNRLRIMTELCALGPGEWLDFVILRERLGVTAGNLGAHLGLLVRGGYIRVEKKFRANRPCTRFSATETGRRAYAVHSASLRELFLRVEKKES